MALGEKLRGEREARQVSIEEISAATGIGRGYLEALESDALKARPGRAKFYIRAYARTLGFDPRQMIDQYDRELEAMGPAPPAPPEIERAAPRPVEAAIARWRKAAIAGARTSGDLALGARASGPQSEGEPRPTASLDSRTDTALDPAPGTSGELVPWARASGELALGARASGPQSDPPPRIPRAAPARSRVRVAASLMVGLIVVLAGIRLIVFKTNADGGNPDPIAAAPASAPASIPAARAPEPSSSPASETLPPPTRRAPAPLPIEDRTGTAGLLTVSESGVGRRIANRRIVGESDTFAPGDVVLFSTIVRGGRRGQVIRHVWIHEGRVQQSIALELGGPDWRTHSRKTLWAEGEWTVEARDEQGEVLAEAAFTCVPGS
jgi:transcriptional regulator with XRE-family HTH domain